MIKYANHKNSNWAAVQPARNHTCLERLFVQNIFPEPWDKSEIWPAAVN